MTEIKTAPFAQEPKSTTAEVSTGTSYPDGERRTRLLQKYSQLGMSLLHLPEGAKKPARSWQDCVLNPASPPSYPYNIAVRLGEPSNGICDIDFDCDAAAEVADLVWPAGPVFGRATSRKSHRLIRCPDAPKTKQVQLAAPVAKQLGLSRNMLLELRGTGGITVLPDSLHLESDEIRLFENDCDTIPVMSAEEAVARLELNAFMAVVRQCYPTIAGTRNAICMALTGTLLRLNRDVAWVDTVVTTIAMLAGDEEASTRSCATATLAKLDAGDPVTGLPKLAELLGVPEMVELMKRWLRLPSDMITPPAGAGMDDMVQWVNSQYFCVLEGGSYSYYREEVDGNLAKMDMQSFKLELEPHSVQVPMGNGKSAMMPLSKHWMRSHNRRIYPSGFSFTDGKPPQGTYNQWRGFGIKPMAGSWQLMRQHVHEVLATGNAGYAEYIIKWAAWSVQNPATPARVALVFTGEEGVGKGMFCTALVKIFGHHGQRIHDVQQLVGHFNIHLDNTSLMFADEAVVVHKDAEGVLKGLITEEEIQLEGKGKDLRRAQNHLHVVMASNNNWVVPAGPSARRYAVFGVSSCRKADYAYFKALNAETQGGGLAAMLYDFLNMQLGDWHPEPNRPTTSALVYQQERSLGALDTYYLDCLKEGRFPLNQANYNSDVVSTDHFRNMVRASTGHNRITWNAISDLFKEMGFQKTRKGTRGYILPDLVKARQAWDKNRFVVEWDDCTEWDFIT